MLELQRILREKGVKKRETQIGDYLGKGKTKKKKAGRPKVNVNKKKGGKKRRGVRLRRRR